VPPCDLELSDRILHPLSRAEFPTVKVKIKATIGPMGLERITAGRPLTCHHQPEISRWRTSRNQSIRHRKTRPSPSESQVETTT